MLEQEGLAVTMPRKGAEVAKMTLKDMEDVLEAVSYTHLIPKDNEKDLEEISKEITDGMEIVPVERFSQVEKIAFVQ